MKKLLLPIGILLIVIGGLWALLSSGPVVYATVVMIVGVAVIAAHLMANFRQVAQRSTMYGLNAIVMSVLMVAILSVIYLIAHNRDQTWDFTITQRYTLDPQTGNILTGLQQPVEFVLFYRTMDRGTPEYENLKSLLDQYQRKSDQITLEVIDPASEYEKAIEYSTHLNNPAQPTLLVKVMQGDKEFIEKAKSLSQEDITNAIKKATHRDVVNAYFLTGHYEREIESEAPTGLALLKQFLIDENITPSPLRLGAAGELPADADMIAVVGPEEDLTEVEIAALRRFVLGGGSLLVALDPQTAPALAEGMRKFGVDVGSDLVIEMSVAAESIEDALLGRYTARPDNRVQIASFDQTHEITKDMANASLTLLQVRSINPVPAPADGITVTPLAKTSAGILQGTNYPNSWADKQPEQFDQPNLPIDELYDPLKDQSGPITLAAAIEVDPAVVMDGQPDPADPGRKGKVVLVGDSDFLTNGGMRVRGGISRGHHDFAMNIFNWLSGQVDLISIREKEVDQAGLNLTPQQKQFAQYFILVAIPVIIIMLGIAAILYRRMRYV